MPWFWTASKSSEHAIAKESLPKNVEANNTSPVSPSSSSSSTSLRFTPTQTIAACLITAGTTLGLRKIYRTRLSRIPNAEHLTVSDLRKRSLYGYVTSVGDADNFHLFHLPGGRLSGWGWLPWRQIIKDKKELKGQTIHVRIAGVDAPELAHFGNAAQPFSQEALAWLRTRVLHTYVRAMPYRRDQYGRVVCSVKVRKWRLFRTDLGLEMLRKGYATVYEAKSGSEFGSLETQYRAAEKRAKEKGVGMWKKPGLMKGILGGGKRDEFESPRQYKERIKKEDAAKNAAGTGAKT